jgi:hypothetical protein
MITPVVRPTHPAPGRTAARAVAAAVLLGLVLRMAFGLGYWVDKPLTHDEHEYLLLADNIAAGRGFHYLQPDGSPSPGEHFGRAPLYPLFLAALMRGTGTGLARGGTDPATPEPALLWIIKVAQAMVGALGVWIVARLAARAAGPQAAVIAAWLCAVYPPLVWTPAYIFSETLYGVLALGAVALIDAAVAAPASPTQSPVSLAAIAAGGLLTGLAILTRPAMLFFVALAAPWLWWKRGPLAATCLVLASIIVIAPWTARNLREYGRFVLVASEGGITFWTGNHPLAIGEGDMAANVALKRANVEFRAANPGLGPESLEPLYYKAAVSWIAANPDAFVVLLARKLFYTVVPIGPSYRLHSTRYFWGSVLAYGAVLPFGILGLWKRGAALPTLLMLAASAVLVCVIFFPQERFRIPVIDPTLLVGAAAWWASRGVRAT